MMRAILSAMATVLLTTGVLSAQHEFSIYGMTGNSRIYYGLNATAVPPSDGSVYSDGNKLQYSLGLGYTYSLGLQWGIVSGLEIKRFNTVVDINSFDDYTRMAYLYNDRIETMYFNSRFTSFIEKQTATMLQIPLLVEYRFSNYGFVHGFTWFAAAGAKLGLGLPGKYTMTAHRFVTSGYLPEQDRTFYDMPELGFVTRDNFSHSGNLDFDINVSLTAETGVRWAVTPRLGIYSGVYFEYCRANILSKSETGVVTYYPEGFAYNSILRSMQQSSGEQFVNKIDFFSIGVKLKVGLKSKKKLRPPQNTEKPSITSP